MSSQRCYPTGQPPKDTRVNWKRRLGLIGILLAVYLVVSALPVTALQTNTVVISQNTTDTDFNAAQELTNVTVEGTGNDASVNFTGSGSGFSPSDVGGLEHWYDPRDLTGSDGDTIGTLSDKQGTDDLVATGTRQPKLRPSLFANGNQGLRFDGSNDNMTATFSSTITEPYTVFIVFAINSSVENDGNIHVMMDGGNADQYRFYKDNDLSPNEWSLFQGTSDIDGGEADANEHVATVILDSGSNTDQVRLNGSININGDSGNQDATGLTIGARATPDLFTNMKVGEILVYDGNLSQTDRNDVEGYLSNEWGVGSLTPPAGSDTSFTTGTYISQNRTVDDPTSGLTNITLDGTEAFVTWEEYNAGTDTWDNIHSPQTFTTSGNKSIDISSATQSKLRVNVTFRNLSTSPAHIAELHDDTVTFTARQPVLDNSTASPSGGETRNTEDVTLQIDLNDSDFPLVQGDSVDAEWTVNGTVITTTTHTANETISTTVTGLGDGDHTWRVNVTDSYGLGNNSQQFSFTTQHATPQVDNNSATPTGDLTTTSPTLSIDITDGDFAPGRDGDSIDVEFFVDGSSIGTDTLTGNGTASIAAGDLLGGSHTWRVTATDSYGNTNNSQTFSIRVPANITIREETPPHPIINTVNADLIFYEDQDDSPTILNKSTSDGNVSLAGVPTGSSFIIRVFAPGYHNRTILLTSIFAQSDAFLLNKNRTTNTVTFQIEDVTGRFAEEDTELQVEHAINESLYNKTGSPGFSWMVVEGDQIGAGGELTTTLQNDERYRLVVSNDEETRVIGGYTVLGDAVETLRPSVPIINVTDDEGYVWNATSNQTDGSFVIFEYFDPDNQTTDLLLIIHEQGNTSRELTSTTVAPAQEPHGYVKFTRLVPQADRNRTWVVDWNATRNGTVIGGEKTVGRKVIEQIGELDEIWQNAIALLVTILVAGLASVRNSNTIAVVTALTGGAFWMIGWLPTAAGAAVTFVLFLALILKFGKQGIPT